MTPELVLSALQESGLALVAILVLGWAYWQERKDNKSLNAEIRANLTEMTTALVSVKESVSGFMVILTSVGAKLDKLEDRMENLSNRNKGG